MKRIFSLSAGVLIVSMFLVSCNGTWFNPPVIVPTIPSQTVLPLSGFDAIDLQAPIHLHLTQSANQRVELVADSFWINRIDVEVIGNTLLVTRVPDSTWTDSIPIYEVDLFVELPNLSKISARTAAKIESVSRFNLGNLLLDLKGAVDVSLEADANTIDLTIAGAARLELDVDLDTLDTDIKGAGKLTATGNADVHNINVLGAGNIESFDLATDASNVRFWGAGSCKLTAQTALDANLRGVNVVYYKGNPSITQNVSLLSRLVDAN